ncbi:MAG: hypothetical protein KME15_19315 [Drouetiella hepatica Uher 2000/2452]|uniref:Uncharacterized protein n=1 Tax=Drouetiella hepatica Uher 2000/2452 TaxID=904376 RepID=A0A951UPH6_9CYAN|nr:hypothetical protein [Drouetiella hepatica Uher 2000/2452]
MPILMTGAIVSCSPSAIQQNPSDFLGLSAQVLSRCKIVLPGEAIAPARVLDLCARQRFKLGTTHGSAELSQVSKSAATQRLQESQRIFQNFPDSLK